MTAMNAEVRFLKAGTLNIEIHPTSKAAGEAAAQAAAQALHRPENRRDNIGVIFATGASQLDTLRPLTLMPGLPWNWIQGFHLDEYIDMAADHAASFRRYLRENLTQKVKLKEFSEIDGTAPNLDQMCRNYVAKLHAANPQLCLLGIGENGHLAFNDPTMTFCQRNWRAHSCRTSCTSSIGSIGFNK